MRLDRCKKRTLFTLLCENLVVDKGQYGREKAIPLTNSERDSSAHLITFLASTEAFEDVIVVIL